MRLLLLGISTITQYELNFICTVIRTEQDTDLLANFLCKLRMLTVNAIVKCCASCLLKTASRQIAACMVQRNESPMYTCTLHVDGWSVGSDLSLSFCLLFLSSQGHPRLWRHDILLCISVL
jgi:hypothetical protein